MAGFTRWGIFSQSCCKVGESGVQWGHVEPDGDGEVPPTSPLPARISLQQGASGVGFSWAVRVHAGREEPAHDSAQVQGSALRWSRSRPGARALHLDPARASLAPVHRPGDRARATPSARRRATSSATTAATPSTASSTPPAASSCRRRSWSTPASARRSRVIGSLDSIEVWDRARWSEYAPRLSEEAPELASRLSESGQRPDGPGTATVTLVLDMTRTHVPVLAGELIDALDPAPGAVAVDCTFGAGGHARLVADRIGAGGELICIDRDPHAEEHFADFAAEAPCATRFIQRRLRGRAARAARGGAARPTSCTSTSASPRCRSTRASAASPTPTTRRSTCAWTRPQELDARTVVNEWPEAAARADLPRSTARSATRAGIAREIVRRRQRGADRDHDRAGRRDQARRPDAGAVRRRASGAARVPGDPDRRQRRARVARARAARGLGAAAPGRPHGRDLVPLARGPDGEALPRRPRARLHLPAGPAGLRLRARARGRADQPPRGAPERRARWPATRARSRAACARR